MSFWDDLKRVGLGIATGGLSEVPNLVGEVTGKPGSVDGNKVYRPEGPSLGAPPPAAEQPSRPPNSAPPIAEGRVATDGRPSDTPTGGQVYDVRDRQAGYAQDAQGLGMQALTRGRGLPLAEAAQGSSAGIDRSRVDRDFAAEAGSRRLQAGNLGRLTAAAEGAVPSAAEVQQQRGLGQALAGQMAAANSARGGAAGQMAARRQAATQGVQLQGQAIQDSAALRAQEQAAARGLLTDAIGAQRAGDVQRLGHQAGLATTQAGLDQQTAMANLTNQQQTNMLNPQMILRSRQMDDARGEALLGLGVRSDALAGQMGLSAAELEQEYQRMLMNRDLEISGANAVSADKAYAARTGMLGSGLGMLTSFLGGG